jgi:hypothetical protein
VRVPWRRGWLTVQPDGLLVEYRQRKPTRLGRLVSVLRAPETDPPPPSAPEKIARAQILRLESTWVAPGVVPVPGRVLSAVLKGGRRVVYDGVPEAASVELLDALAHQGVSVIEDGVHWPTPTGPVPVVRSTPPRPAEYRQLLCPRCNAPLTTGLRQCPYCRAPLVLD